VIQPGYEHREVGLKVFSDWVLTDRAVYAKYSCKDGITRQPKDHHHGYAAQTKAPDYIQGLMLLSYPESHKPPEPVCDTPSTQFQTNMPL